jgi:hypothetical protein
MTLNRIGVLSCGKVLGTLYVAVGFVFGLIFSLISVLGMAIGAGSGEIGGGQALFGMLFGIGAVIILPIFYGIMGFLGGLLMAALYNLVARVVGGIELDLS